MTSLKRGCASKRVNRFHTRSTFFSTLHTLSTFCSTSPKNPTSRKLKVQRHGLLGICRKWWKNAKIYILVIQWLSKFFSWGATSVRIILGQKEVQYPYIEAPRPGRVMSDRLLDGQAGGSCGLSRSRRETCSGTIGVLYLFLANHWINHCVTDGLLSWGTTKKHYPPYRSKTICFFFRFIPSSWDCSSGFYIFCFFPPKSAVGWEIELNHCMHSDR